MRRLSSVILLLVLAASLFAQKSPHGDTFKTNCGDCHKTDGWKVDLKTVSFDHNKTKFQLVGQHREITCTDCHKSLDFAKAPTECSACHTDIHEQTVGNECARCHTPNSWMVTSITQLHQLSRFPLIGPHTVADCKDCHKNLLESDPAAGTASRLRFDPLGVECYDCHKNNYTSTTSPNHVLSNYPTSCEECHKMNSFSWTGASINHSFFPLEGGHAIDCNRCHTSGTYSKIPSECISCHQPDYVSAKNPDHVALNFPTTCDDCHTLDPGWKPADFKQHDPYFPIYSGKHNGVWNSCAECHTNPANYAQFTCISTCHEHSNQSEVDSKHNGVGGYVYNSTSCYACHPTGSSEKSLNHSTTSFPLTGAHITTACTDCHTNGYAGASTVCADCHTNNYNQTTNPNHNAIGITNDCATCHTTNPGWNPAAFPTHNNYYVIEGAHISKACGDCHKGNYNSTPNTCAGCHMIDFNQTTNPNHTTSVFPTTCETCHSQSSWVPSTFNHTSVYPLTGSHTTVACASCHTTGYINTPNTCAGCHTNDYNQTTNPNHTTSQFPKTCETCHTPSAWIPSTFNHASVYPLTGAHTTVVCTLCHTSGYVNTPNTCVGCHQNNFNQTSNPNHSNIGIATDCQSCHTTNPGWTPAAFPTHNNYYILAGAHVSATCDACHKGNYKSTPNTCAGCHTSDYNKTTNPNHTAAHFPNTCADCHSQSAWIPSNWNHDGQYFPIYSGKHLGQWTTCADCHKNAGDYSQFSCIDCHEHNSTDMNDKHKSIAGYSYNSAACYSCHPKGIAGGG